MATLYRKYRPQTWQEVVGQNHIKITLQHEIASGKVGQAYLFCGPRGVGKTTVARVLAKSVNCQKRKEGRFEPCNSCDSCEDIVKSKSLDIIEIDAASHTGVDNVRENIIAASRVSPSRDKNKVFIIDEVHMLSISAFNALLKILEEPPENVIFVLCTTEVHKVPATIVSRCERFDFKRISMKDVVKKLQLIANSDNIKVSARILQAVARHSEGHMRDAESVLGQMVAIGGHEISDEDADLVIPRSDLNEVVNLINYIMRKDAGQGIALANKLIDEGVDLKNFLSDLIEMLRKLILMKISTQLADKISHEWGEHIEKELNQIARDTTVDRLVKVIEKMLAVRNELKSSFIVQLPLEIAITELCLSPAGNPSASSARPAGPAPAADTAPPAPSSAGKSKNISTGGPLPVTDINKETIIEKWNEVLARIKQHNHSLSFILRVCQPRELTGNQLCLAFKYKFHKDRINEVNIRQIVERVLQEVYGRQLLIEAIIDENIEVPAANNGPEPAVKDAEKGSGENGDMINNLLKTFGGKIIE